MSAHHLLRYHHHGLCRKSPVAMVEKIFERGAEKVDNKNVVKAFLAEIIYIRDTSYLIISNSRFGDCLDYTDGSQRGFYMFDIRLAIEEHRFSEVPIEVCVRCECSLILDD